MNLKVVRQIGNCPTAALSCERRSEGAQNPLNIIRRNEESSENHSVNGHRGPTAPNLASKSKHRRTDRRSLDDLRTGAYPSYPLAVRRRLCERQR
jgi:hypothetical protein